ncbi:pseudouridine synthase [Multifurca ochricompacta]|uniref:Pseudouridine synthase n=1 Tax=Multifurca ochricompacta TaxID=376703 RepID=A0AAD4M3M8_9AGAM|nr:pseudouridine synthase [Multifurca ochricompacta]
MFGKIKSKSVLCHVERSRTIASVATQTHEGLDVLYIDRGVIVLNKPPGLVSQGISSTHVGAPFSDKKHLAAPPKSAFNIVLDGLRRKYGLNENPYPVHRLDKGTTGVLILACTKALARELSRQFRTHAIGKTYFALIAAHHAQLGNKSARTAWEVLSSSVSHFDRDDVAPLSLLRVHLAHGLRVPILGDTLYDSPMTAQQNLASTSVPENRLFLHSSSISFWDAVQGGAFVDGERVKGGELTDVDGHWLGGLSEPRSTSIPPQISQKSIQ